MRYVVVEVVIIMMTIIWRGEGEEEVDQEVTAAEYERREEEYL